MSVTICKYNHLLGVVVSGIMLFLPMSASAKCGGVDYSWGADALANAHDYTVTMMLYVVYLSYAIAGLVAVIGALQIYIKMQTGEGDITKSIMMLIGACLFMIGAYVLFPAFFGYNIISTNRITNNSQLAGREINLCNKVKSLSVKHSNFRKRNEDNQKVRKEHLQTKPHENGSTHAPLRHSSNICPERSG